MSLKKFLWEEGVRGANDTPKSVKVYPPRELYLFRFSHTASLLVLQPNTSIHGPIRRWVKLKSLFWVRVSNSDPVLHSAHEFFLTFVKIPTMAWDKRMVKNTVSINFQTLLLTCH
jgi:hypothetical protein